MCRKKVDEKWRRGGEQQHQEQWNGCHLLWQQGIAPLGNDGILLPKHDRWCNNNVCKCLFSSLLKLQPTLIPHPGLPWGSNSQEERSVRVARAGGSPVTLRRFPRNLAAVPPSHLRTGVPTALRTICFQSCQKMRWRFELSKMLWRPQFPPKCCKKMSLAVSGCLQNAKRSLKMS